MKNLIFAFIILFSIFSCKPQKPVYSSFTGYAQGSSYSIVYENKKNKDPEELKQKTEKILNDFDSSLSLYKDSSILSRVNRNEDVTLDTYFKEVFSRSAAISEMTDGAFDITVGPLVKAWGFGPDAHKSFTSAKRDSLLNLVGMEKVSIKNGHLIKTNPHIILDFNAIAQGYSVDVICRFFDSLKIRNYLIEIGGEVRAKGTKAGQLWRIGIDKPEDNNLIPGQDLEAVIRISNKALATSGNYRKFYIEDGVKYSHEINPKTGYPAKNTLLSASILAKDCATADGVATACMVKGKDRTIEFLSSHPEFEAYLIYSDETGNFKTWMSDGLKGFLTEADQE